MIGVFLSFGLIGCGGGSSDSNRQSNTILTGFFVDAPVKGLKYETASQSGYTNGVGLFKYKNGETITFKIGNLELGSAKGSDLITPIELDKNVEFKSFDTFSITKATNIARILQSLDENKSNTKQISIPISLEDLNISNIDLLSEADLNDVLAKAADITLKPYVLQDAYVANVSMKNDINSYKSISIFGSILDSQRYIYPYGTSKTYKFVMENDGNILISRNWRTKATLYDWNLNNGTNFTSGNLKAGIYILKVYYAGYYTYSQGKFKFLTTDNKPYGIDPIVSGKTLSGIWDNEEFYTLDIKNDTRLHISTSGIAYTAKLYDYNLNYIKTLRDGFWDITSGKYIVEVIYTSNGGVSTNSRGEMIFTSSEIR